MCNLLFLKRDLSEETFWRNVCQIGSHPDFVPVSFKRVIEIAAPTAFAGAVRAMTLLYGAQG